MATTGHDEPTDQVMICSLRRNVMDTIVVGVDGSAGSIEAIRWAAAEAKLRGAKLRAVAAWEFPFTSAGFGDSISMIPIPQLEADAKRMLDDALIAAIDDPVALSTVDRAVICGHATSILRTESKDATMVVVGARGHGGFVGLLLGSTSDQLVKHASCPVVVVRNAESS
jgi:nucleotide-binding universal stress UspA family protein